MLTDRDATHEQMRSFAKKAALEVKEGATLWFIYIGHGAPSQDGKDGLLIGMDSQATFKSLQGRSIT